MRRIFLSRSLFNFRSVTDWGDLGLSLTLLFALVITHWWFPNLRYVTRKFLHLAYHDPISDKYGLGTDDFYVVSFWIVLLTGLRAATMTHVLVPLARWGGVKKRKGRVRFAEQAWLFLYAAVFFSLGMVCVWAFFSRRARSLQLQFQQMIKKGGGGGSANHTTDLSTSFAVLPIGSIYGRCGQAGPTGRLMAF